MALSRSLRWALGILGSVILFPTVFLTLHGTITVSLWLLVYGDTQGGRWEPFGWPVAGAFAGGVSTLFLLRVGAGWPTGWRPMLGGVAALCLVSLAWLSFAVAVLLPPCGASRRLARMEVGGFNSPMSSRNEILSRIRRRPVPAVDLPSLDQEWQTFDDVRAKFAEVLKSVGGEAVAVPDFAAANAELAKLATYTAADKIVSLVPGVGEPNVNVDAVERPHDLEDVDYAILPGRFAVAENGAVWLDLRAAKQRVICVLSQHLALVVPAPEIVPTMHEAYARLTRSGPAQSEFVSRPGYGLFISGPSKTADIEQSLVIGAHGARSLTVFLVENPPG